MINAQTSLHTLHTLQTHTQATSASSTTPVTTTQSTSSDELSCRCRNRCFEKISSIDQIEILAKFIAFSSTEAQDKFLEGLVELEEAPVPTNYVYYVELQERRVKVCRKAFKTLYNLNDKRIRRISSPLSRGKRVPGKKSRLCGTGRSRQVQGDAADKMSEHIESFEVRQAHYGNRTIKYLRADLNVKTMHKMFSDKYPHCPVKYVTYLKFFQDNYSYMFGRPIQLNTTQEELDSIVADIL